MSIFRYDSAVQTLYCPHASVQGALVQITAKDLRAAVWPGQPYVGWKGIEGLRHLPRPPGGRIVTLDGRGNGR